MKYMVKCKFCSRTFIVNSNAKDVDFCCKTCGGQNGKEDIVEKIQPMTRFVSAGKKEEDDLKSIKNFNINDYKVDDDPFIVDSYDKDSDYMPMWCRISGGVIAIAIYIVVSLLMK